MAIDSRNKRGSVLQYQNPGVFLYPNPDGTLDSSDRLHLAKLYSGISASSLTAKYPVHMVISSVGLGAVTIDGVGLGAVTVSPRES